MKVINLWGGPGSGKSTNAAGVFYEMKLRGINCELVGEYAKDMTWREMPAESFLDQFYITAKQNHRLERLRGKVDYVITDSPILQGLVYTEKYYPSFHKFVREVYDSYENINFFVTRTKEFKQVGRKQTEYQAKGIDGKIMAFLNENDLPFSITYSESAKDDVMRSLG